MKKLLISVALAALVPLGSAHAGVTSNAFKLNGLHMNGLHMNGLHMNGLRRSNSAAAPAFETLAAAPLFK